MSHRKRTHRPAVEAADDDDYPFPIGGQPMFTEDDWRAAMEGLGPAASQAPTVLPSNGPNTMLSPSYVNMHQPYDNYQYNPGNPNLQVPSSSSYGSTYPAMAASSSHGYGGFSPAPAPAQSSLPQTAASYNYDYDYDYDYDSAYDYSGDPGSSSRAGGASGSLTCPDCSETFGSQHDLSKHVRKHVKPEKCPVCGAQKAALRDLHRHIWTDHKDYAARENIPSESRQCPVAGCTYTGRKDNLARHCKKKHGQTLKWRRGQPCLE